MIKRLNDRARQTRGEENGFTLIELLVVIAILAILAGVVVLSVSGLTERGGKSACKAEHPTMLTAKEAAAATDAADTPLNFLTTGGGTGKYWSIDAAGVITNTKAVAGCP